MLLRACFAIHGRISPAKALRAPPCTAVLAGLGMRRFAFGPCRIRMEEQRPPSATGLPQGAPLALLERHFQSVQSNTVPLFKDLETYLASLPVRYYNQNQEFLRLHELEHWVRDEDLQVMVDRLEAPPRNTRHSVKYLAAPGASGKTSSVLPAFLKSAAKKSKAGGFTHYLYIACDNNKKRNFRLGHAPSAVEEIAEDQGAAFIFEAVKILVDHPDREGPFLIDLGHTELSVKEATHDQLTKYLQDRFGRESKLLIHVDEHPKMCKREGEPGGKHFSRGAMECLAQVPNVTVVATYTRPPYLPAAGSSQVCRFPVAVPCPDIDRVMRRVPELSFSDAHKAAIERNRQLRRLWATLRFRLAVQLRELGLGGLHRRGTDTTMEKLLEEIATAAKKPDTTGVLEQCIHLCEMEFNTDTEDPNAVRLLLGVKEHDLPDSIERQASDLVVVGDIYTTSLMHLLDCDTVDNPVYYVGRDRLRTVLAGGAPDFLAATPLEAAYTWTLSCRASVKKKLTLANITHPIECKWVLPGRIFPGDSDKDGDLSKLQPDTIYYAREGTEGLSTHPLADIFFRTSNGDFVLIDVTGGSAELAVEKAQKLGKWIGREQQKKKYAGSKLHGVVLAPLGAQIKKAALAVSADDALPGSSAQHRHESQATTHGAQGTSGAPEHKAAVVPIVSGAAALGLLGGLRQVFRWL